MNKIADKRTTDNTKQPGFSDAVYRYDKNPGESYEDAFKRSAKPFDEMVVRTPGSGQDAGNKNWSDTALINKAFNDHNSNAGVDKNKFKEIAYSADDPAVDDAVGTFLGKTLFGNPAEVYITQQGLFPEVFDKAGFFRTKDDGIYHAKFDCWQEAGGYNDYYNNAFQYFSDMNDQPFDFTYNGQKLRLWAWKGDYLNLGAGAEMGMYKDSGVEIGGAKQYVVDKENYKLPMELTLKDNDKNTLFTYSPSEKQWWITGFDPDKQNAKAAELTACITIDFKDNPDMYEAFIQSPQYLQAMYKWTVEDKKRPYRLTFTF